MTYFPKDRKPREDLLDTYKQTQRRKKKWLGKFALLSRIPPNNRQNERSCKDCHVGSRLLSNTANAKKKMKEKECTWFGGTRLKCTSALQVLVKYSGPEISARPWVERCPKAGWPEAGGGLPLGFVLDDPAEALAFDDCVCGLSAKPLPISGEEWHQTEAPEGSKNQVGPPILIRFADMIWLRLGERTKYRDHYWILFRIKHLCSEPMILNKFWSPKIQSSWFTDGKTGAPNEKGFAQSHTVWGKNTGPWLCGQGPCPPCGLFLFNINRAGQEAGLGAVAVICLVTREHPGWSSYLRRCPPPLLSLRHMNCFPDALLAFKMGSLSGSIRPSNKHLLSTYYMLDTVLGTGEEGGELALCSCSL